jgi:glycosyltransferase involved in cell wall biosynthesis
MNARTVPQLNNSTLISEDIIDQLNRDNLRLKGENEHLRNKCGALHNELTSLIGSTSWKVTTPLRRIAELYRSIMPLLRFGGSKLKIESGSVNDTEGESVGQIMYLRSTRKLFGGWVELSYSLQNGGHHQSFFLYFDHGSGFNGDARTVLTLLGDNNKGKKRAAIKKVLLRLPEDTVNLRLDVFDRVGDIHLDNLYIKPLGKLQVAFKWCLAEFLRGGLSPSRVYNKTLKTCSILRSGGFIALKTRLQGRLGMVNAGDYQEWLRHYDTLTDVDHALMKEKQFEYTPLISILMPTFNTPLWALRKAIESVIDQTYPNWELCIADDASDMPGLREVLEEYQRRDARIRVTIRPSNGHISIASNSCLEMASGDYVAFLDHDDELASDALYCVVDAVNSNPEARFFYSDEDKITEEGLRHNPYFKSDWNPVLFLSQNYVCHFSVIETKLVREVGGFRRGFEGAQDWDLFLRVTERLNHGEIKHLPFILYHWRAMSGSTAAGTLHKPYVLEAQKKAVSEHLTRRGISADVSILHDISQLRVSFNLPSNPPLVSIIIPTRDQVDFLGRCVDSILKKTIYPNYEIIIVDNNSEQQDTFTYFASVVRNQKVKVVRDERPFNFSALNNRAVDYCNGSVFAFVNNDIEVITPEWLGELVSYALRPEVGAVGARLLYPNGILQHGGVILGIGGIAGHNHKGRPRHDVGYFNRAILPQNLSAVTAACLVMRKEVFDEVGGFDEEHLAVAFNDVDLCLRIREHGYLNVYNPYAECYHHESVSRGYETTREKFNRFEGEIATMKKRWGTQLAADPYYNPNLTLLAEDFGFAYPPRVTKPWLN